MMTDTRTNPETKNVTPEIQGKSPSANPELTSLQTGIKLDQLENQEVSKLLEDMKLSYERYQNGTETFEKYKEIETKIKPVLAKKLLKSPNYIPQAVQQLGIDNFRDDVMWSLFMSPQFQSKLKENYNGLIPIKGDLKKNYKGKDLITIKKASAFDLSVKQIFGVNDDFIQAFVKNVYDKNDFENGFFKLGEDVGNKMDFGQAHQKLVEAIQQNNGALGSGTGKRNGMDNTMDSFLKGGLYGATGDLMTTFGNGNLNKFDRFMIVSANFGAMIYFAFKAFKGFGFWKTIFSFAGLHITSNVITGHSLFDWGFRACFGGLDQAVDDTKKSLGRIGASAGFDSSDRGVSSKDIGGSTPKISKTVKDDMQEAKGDSSEEKLAMTGSYMWLSQVYFSEKMKISHIKTFLTKDGNKLKFNSDRYIADMRTKDPEKADSLETEIAKHGKGKFEKTIIKLFEYIGINSQTYDGIDENLSFENYYKKRKQDFVKEQKQKNKDGGQKKTDTVPSRGYAQGTVDSDRALDVRRGPVVLFEGSVSEMQNETQKKLNQVEQKLPADKKLKFDAIVRKKGATYSNLWFLLLNDAKIFNEDKLGFFSRQGRNFDGEPVYKKEIISMLENSIEGFKSKVEEIRDAVDKNDMSALDRILNDIDQLCEKSFAKIREVLGKDSSSYAKELMEYKKRFDAGESYAVYEFMSKSMDNKEFNEMRVMESFDFEPPTDRKDLEHILVAEYDQSRINDYFKNKHSQFSIFGKKFDNPDISYAKIVATARNESVGSELGTVDPVYVLSKVMIAILKEREKTILSANFDKEQKEHIKLFYGNRGYFNDLLEHFRSWTAKMAVIGITMFLGGKAVNGILGKILGRYAQSALVGYGSEFAVLHFGGYLVGGILSDNIGHAMKQSMKGTNMVYSAVSIGALRGIDAVKREGILVNGFVTKGTRFVAKAGVLGLITFVFNKEVSVEDLFNIFAFVAAHELTTNKRGIKTVSVDKSPNGRIKVTEVEPAPTKSDADTSKTGTGTPQKTESKPDASKGGSSESVKTGEPAKENSPKSGEPEPKASAGPEAAAKDKSGSAPLSSENLKVFTTKEKDVLKKSISSAEKLVKKGVKGKQEKIDPKLEKNKQSFAEDIKKKSVTQDQKAMETQVVEHYNEYIEKLKGGNPEEIKLAKEQLDLSHKKWTEARGTQNNIAIQEEAANNIAEGNVADISTEVGKQQKQMESGKSGNGTGKLMKLIKAMNPISADAREFGTALKKIVLEGEIKGNRSKVIKMLTLGTMKLEGRGFVNMLIRIFAVDAQVISKRTNKDNHDSWRKVGRNALFLGALKVRAIALCFMMSSSDFKPGTIGYESMRKATQSMGGISQEGMHEIAERLGSIPGDTGKYLKEKFLEFFTYSDGRSNVEREI